jgi:DNA-binding transcriptional regulator YiaG
LKKKKQTTNEQARAIFDASGLTLEDFAALIGVSRHTVYNWFRPPGGKAHRHCQPIALRLMLAMQKNGELQSEGS